MTHHRSPWTALVVVACIAGCASPQRPFGAPLFGTSDRSDGADEFRFAIDPRLGIDICRGETCVRLDEELGDDAVDDGFFESLIEVASRSLDHEESSRADGASCSGGVAKVAAAGSVLYAIFRLHRRSGRAAHMQHEGRLVRSSVETLMKSGAFAERVGREMLSDVRIAQRLGAAPVTPDRIWARIVEFAQTTHGDSYLLRRSLAGARGRVTDTHVTFWLDEAEITISRDVVAAAEVVVLAERANASLAPIVARAAQQDWVPTVAGVVGGATAIGGYLTAVILAQFELGRALLRRGYETVRTELAELPSELGLCF